MRIFRARFTVRRLMVAVAIVGLVLGSGRWLVVMRARSDAYRRKSSDFAQCAHGRLQANWSVTTKDGRIIEHNDDEDFWLRHAWAAKLANRSWRLADRPWLAAGPDPPPPEPLAHPRPAVDCPAELTLGGSHPCRWCASTPWWKNDPVYPWWTLLWSWPPKLYPGSPLPPRYSFP
jgi:hypothetical protein